VPHEHDHCGSIDRQAGRQAGISLVLGSRGALHIAAKTAVGVLRAAGLISRQFIEEANCCNAAKNIELVQHHKPAQMFPCLPVYQFAFMHPSATWISINADDVCCLSLCPCSICLHF
jgi:hypothetical protein